MECVMKTILPLLFLAVFSLNVQSSQFKFLSNGPKFQITSKQTSQLQNISNDDLGEFIGIIRQCRYLAGFRISKYDLVKGTAVLDELGMGKPDIEGMNFHSYFGLTDNKISLYTRGLISSNSEKMAEILTSMTITQIKLSVVAGNKLYQGICKETYEYNTST
jgi:hypothetical protein